jgi:hypothetical protein
MFVTGLIRMRRTDSRRQNLTKGETAQQAEEDSSNEEVGEDEKKEETCAYSEFSEVKQTWTSSSVLWTLIINTTNIT